MTNIIGIIPARGGSVGIKHKNIKLLCDKPLITYTIEAALKSKYLKNIYIYSDDSEIRAVASRYPVNLNFIENSDIANGNINVFPFVLRDLINKIEAYDNLVVDKLCIMLPTSPLRKDGDIDRAIELYLNSDCDWVTAVSEVNRHPFRMRYLDSENNLKPIIDRNDIWEQRQRLPTVYQFTGSIYVTSRDVLMSSDIWNTKWKGVIIDQEDGLDIDSEDDFLIAESIMMRRNSNV